MSSENSLPALAAFHLRAASVYAVLGMAFGIYMGIKQDFSLMPAHAHLNVLGWLSITVYGLVIARFPHVAQSRLTLVQGIVAHLGLLIFVPGIMIAILTDHEVEQLVMIGSMLVLLGGVLFVPVVWLATGRR